MPDASRSCFVCGRSRSVLYRLDGPHLACRDCMDFCRATRRNAKRDTPADPTAERALRRIELDEASDQAVAQAEESRLERDDVGDWTP